jgi:hypothetical protein
MALTLDSWYSNPNSDWMRRQMPRLVERYLTGNIILSPHLHQLVYGESLPHHPSLPLSATVENHLHIVHGPAGGINTNDYHYIPVEFRRHFYALLANQSTAATCSNADALFSYLETNYGIQGPLAAILVWYHTYNDTTKQIVKRDARC